MKKSLIPACLILVMAVVIALGSQTFLSPCIHEDGTFGPCHWAGRMETGIGCALAVLALLAIFMKGRGVFLSICPVCVLGIVTPGVLIDLCHMPTMRCRMLMQPAMILLFSAALLSAILGAILSER